MQFLPDDIDKYISGLTVFSDQFSKDDLYLFFSYGGEKKFCRVLRDKNQKNFRILSNQTIVKSNEDIFKRASDLDDKLDYDFAVILAEDNPDSGFPGTIAEKIQLILLNYDLAKEMSDENIPFN